jgi:DNA-binding NarL/FixJ family response regulator
MPPLERNLYPAEIGPRHRRALKARIDVWISQSAVGRHARRADTRRVAQDAEGRVVPVKQVLDVGEYQHVLGDLIRRTQAGHRYVTKASAPHVLVEAIHAVAAGRKYLSADVAQRLALRNYAADQSEGLSAREIEVLGLLAQGQSIKEIAQSMGLSPKTIANHQSAIKQKLDADTALQLLRKASDLGLEL